MSLKTTETPSKTEGKKKVLPDLTGYPLPYELLMGLRGIAGCSIVEAHKRFERLLVILAHLSIGDEVGMSQEDRRTWYLYGKCNPVEYDELMLLRLDSDIPPPKTWK